MSDRIVYVATINVPGYMPEGDPYYAHTSEECWRYLVKERERAEDDYWTAYDGPVPAGPDYSVTVAQLRQAAHIAHEAPEAARNIGTVYGASPGSDSEHDLGLAYTVDVTSDARWDDESDSWVAVDGD